jgi:hypothetical protein
MNSMRTLRQPRRPLPFAIGRLLNLMAGDDWYARRFRDRVRWALVIPPVVILLTHVAPQVLGWGDGWR